MIVSCSNSVTVSELTPETYGMICDLAEGHRAGKSGIVRAILQAVTPQTAEKIVADQLGLLKKPRGRRHKVLHAEAVDQPYRHVSRRQDDICREIHGEIPMGMHCAYPNCRCGG